MEDSNFVLKIYEAAAEPSSSDWKKKSRRGFQMPSNCFERSHCILQLFSQQDKKPRFTDLPFVDQLQDDVDANEEQSRHSQTNPGRIMSYSRS